MVEEPLAGKVQPVTSGLVCCRELLGAKWKDGQDHMTCLWCHVGGACGTSCGLISPKVETGWWNVACLSPGSGECLGQSLAFHLGEASARDSRP